MDRLVREAIEIRLNTEIRGGGFTMSRVWYSVTNLLFNQKAGPGTADT
jgi:hypothetical protein